jgi:hypothetical protein
LLYFLPGVLLVQCVGPVNDRPHRVVPVVLKLRQVLFVLDFLAVLFLAANLPQRGVDGKTVQPGGKLGIAAKHFGLAIDGPKNILNDFLGIRSRAENSLGDAVSFGE